MLLHSDFLREHSSKSVHGSCRNFAKPLGRVGFAAGASCDGGGARRRSVVAQTTRKTFLAQTNYQPVFLTADRRETSWQEVASKQELS